MTEEQFERLIGAIERLTAALERTGGRTMGVPPAGSQPPKWFKCPACDHDSAIHREAGCDVRPCECPVPFGLIAPGDPS